MLILAKICLFKTYELCMYIFGEKEQFELDCERSTITSLTYGGGIDLDFSNREQSRIETFNLCSL